MRTENNIALSNEQILKLLSEADRIQERLLMNINDDILRNYKISLDRVQLVLAKLYGNLAGSDPKNYYPDAVKQGRLKNLIQQIKSEIAKLKIKDAELTKQSIQSFYVESYEKTNWAISTGLETSLNFGSLPEKAIEAIVKNPLDKIGWPNRSRANIMELTRNIRDEITQGLIQGKGYVETAKAVNDKMSIGAFKAFRIVSTETGRATSEGRYESFNATDEAAKELGLIGERYWMHSAGVKEPRISHEDMNDQAADKDGLFHLPAAGKLPAVTTKGPRLSGHPDHDIFCHCTAAYRVKLPQ
jgi:hypothetical protein